MSPTSHQATKAHLQATRQRLHAEYLTHPSPHRLLQTWQKTVDPILVELWNSHSLPSRGITLIAVGGYGRRELYPYSDIDLLILLAHPEDESHRSRLEQFVGALWDIGLEAGHSVRTFEECLAEAQRDVTIATTLADPFYLCGDRALHQRLADTLPNVLNLAQFRLQKLDEQRQRHRKYHDTAFNLEPNLKESPGGLRDLHMVLWMAWGAGLTPSYSALVSAGLITPQELRQVKGLWRFLQDLRIRLHGLAQRREDRLLFDHQTELALQLGFQDTPRRRASEALMQAYYQAAKSVVLFNAILLEQLSGLSLTLPEPEPLSAPFVRQGDLLGTQPETVLAHDPHLIFRGFLLLQQYPELRGFTPAALRAVWRGKQHINAHFRAERAAQQQFMEILRQPSRTADVLRRMNYCGILGRYIPAFGRIVGQLQHDLYHVYTVDEHTLRVVRNLRRFSMTRFDHEFPFCSQLMQQFDRPDLLYLAALFHDIAKGRGGNHAQLGRSDALYFCRRHHLPREDTQLVGWLVEQHLEFSSVAQKQDLSNSMVIMRFAERMVNVRQLTALYLLTVADIRGTSPKVWNAWKGKLLEDLYRLTAQYLDGLQAATPILPLSRQQQTLKVLRHYGIDAAEQVSLWKFVTEAYFQRHDVNDLSWHARSLQGHTGLSRTVVKARLSPIGEGFQVLIYTPDRKALFAHICEYFERKGHAIMAAQLDTTSDQQALDTFQIMPQHGAPEHYRTRLKSIETELQSALMHPGPLPPPRNARVPRQLRHFPFTSRVMLGEPETNGYRTLAVMAGDRPGLLYRLADILVRHDIDIHEARINTMGERVEDVFVVATETLESPEKQEQLRYDLLTALNPASV